MAEPKTSVNALAAKAAFDAAKDAATRAFADATSTEEERAARKVREAEAARRRRSKYLALAVIGALFLLGAIGLALHFWYWFLLAGVVGALALYGRHRFRASRTERQQNKDVPAEPAARAAVAPIVEASPDPSIEDELASLKARLKK